MHLDVCIEFSSFVIQNSSVLRQKIIKFNANRYVQPALGRLREVCVDLLSVWLVACLADQVDVLDAEALRGPERRGHVLVLVAVLEAEMDVGAAPGDGGGELVPAGLCG